MLPDILHVWRWMMDLFLADESLFMSYFSIIVAVNYPAPLGRGFPAIMANTCTTEM